MPSRPAVRRLAAALPLGPLLLLAAAMPTTAHAATPVPGSNGDVKIHAVGTSFTDQANEPHVCKFYLDAFNFDPIQKVAWSIDQQPPTGHALASSGDLTLINGSGHTKVMTLPVGHYKLTWTFAGEKGNAKSKVFWSDCAGAKAHRKGHGSLASTGIDVPTSLAAGGGLAALGLCLMHRTPRRRRRTAA